MMKQKSSFQCFFCATEKDFKSLCTSIQDELIAPEKQPLFELCAERLAQWSPAEDLASEAIAASSCKYLYFYIKLIKSQTINRDLKKYIILVLFNTCVQATFISKDVSKFVCIKF